MAALQKYIHGWWCHGIPTHFAYITKSYLIKMYIKLDRVYWRNVLTDNCRKALDLDVGTKTVSPLIELLQEVEELREIRVRSLVQRLADQERQLVGVLHRSGHPHCPLLKKQHIQSVILNTLTSLIRLDTQECTCIIEYNKLSVYKFTV